MSSIGESIDTLFNRMENFASSKTVVGEPITYGDIIVVPLVDVSFGVGAGSSDAKAEKNGKSSGMGGLGAKITPSAMLVINKGNVQMVSMKDTNSINKIIDMVPGIVSKFSFFNGDSSDAVAEEPVVEE